MCKSIVATSFDIMFCSKINQTEKKSLHDFQSVMC